MKFQNDLKSLGKLDRWEIRVQLQLWVEFKKLTSSFNKLQPSPSIREIILNHIYTIKITFYYIIIFLWYEMAHSKILPFQPVITCSKLTIETLEQCVKCSKLTIKTPERRHWRHQNDAIGVVLVSLLLTLDIFHTLF